ncbi:Cro/CI family transcriptional regulator [Pseudomonas petrae]|uniref:Cro/CI family transcriptional regulator n=1 Tax=Pseudomonas petrae TaxID=2912190 RepID=A0ABS9HYG7_9PSED|nr:Cro/CI family transcriptional regulator [Pseudomonas petrae]MCF7540615.1 Cro/CI family transcriptional regulator [Pseudomonas petrae]
MKEVPLAEYLSEHGSQPRLATALGITQSAVSQMLKSTRSIFVHVFDDGSLEAVEVKRIPNRPSKPVTKNASTFNANLRPNPPADQSAGDAGTLYSAGAAR